MTFARALFSALSKYPANLMDGPDGKVAADLGVPRTQMAETGVGRLHGSLHALHCQNPANDTLRCAVVYRICHALRPEDER
jgi:hypothetical protein